MVLVASVWRPVGAGAQTTTVNLPLTFHNYSLSSKAANNSEFIYDGADGLGPKTGSGVRTTLVSQIKQQYGIWEGWDARIRWTLMLGEDVHVLGVVSIRVFASSTATVGFFSGGGYVMGLADINENGNEGEAYVTEGPQSIGSNPFTSYAKMYTLNVQVDHIFKKGHKIGFFMGAGSNIQGFTFDVYFDSPDWNSGTTLPVVAQNRYYVFDATWGNLTSSVGVASNSSLSDFGFDQSMGRISLKASGILGTGGYSTVSVPKSLLQGPFIVFVNGQQVAASESENSTYSFITLTYSHDSSAEIQGTVVVSEPSLLTVWIVMTLALALLQRMKNRQSSR
jgi:hypothetical protein